MSEFQLSSADAELTVPLNIRQDPEVTTEQQIVQLFTHIPKGFQEHFRPYIFSNELHINQRKALALDAIDATSSEALDAVLLRAKAWAQALFEKSHAVGKLVITGTIYEAPRTADAFLAQALDDDGKSDGVEASKIAQPNTAKATAESGPPSPMSQTALASETIQSAQLRFTDFKELFDKEIRAIFEQENNSFLQISALKGHGSEHVKAFAKVLEAVNRRFNKPYLGDDVIPQQLVAPIVRALVPTERGKIIDFPRQFSPQAFKTILSEHNFDTSLQTSEKPTTLSVHNIQLAPAAITNIKLATIEKGNIVALPEAEQPKNLLDFFETQLGGPLPQRVFEILHGRDAEGRLHAQTQIDELRFGPLKNGALGIEVVVQQSPDITNLARLAAMLIGNHTRCEVIAKTVKIY